jgi:hypothetical protein
MQSIRAVNAVGVELSHYRQPTSIIIEIYEEIFEEKKLFSSCIAALFIVL